MSDIISRDPKPQQMLAEARETYHRLKALEAQQPNETAPSDSPTDQKSNDLSQAEDTTTADSL